MAALALPLLEMAGEAIAAAWTAFVSSGAATATAGGVATAGVVIGIDQATKDKNEAQTKAQTDAATRTRSRDCKCPPDSGQPVTRNWNMSKEARAYQAYVTGFAPMTEWRFANVDFDGFKSPLCQLEEAKAKYDQFFENNGEPKPWWVDSGAADMLEEAERQNYVVESNPKSKLRWYFMQPKSHTWARRQFVSRGYAIMTELKPMMATVETE